MRCVDCINFERIDTRTWPPRVVCSNAAAQKLNADIDRGCLFAKHKPAPKFTVVDRKYSHEH